MNFRFQPQKSRLLGPRVVIYTILILAMAWVMMRYDKNLEEDNAKRNIATPQEVTLKGVPAASTLPRLVLLTDSDNNLDDLVNQANKELKDKCLVSVVTAAGDSDLAILKKAFQVDLFPTAILFDKDDQEISRVAPPLTLERLQELFP